MSKRVAAFPFLCIGNRLQLNYNNKYRSKQYILWCAEK